MQASIDSTPPRAGRWPAAVAAAMFAALAITGATLHARAGSGDTAAAYDAAMEKLAAATLDFDAEDLSIADVAEFVQKRAGVNVVLDPRVRRERTDEEMTVSLSVKGSNAKQVLELCARSVDLGIGWRGGAVLITWREDAERSIPRAVAAIDITAMLTVPRESFGPYWQFTLSDYSEWTEGFGEDYSPVTTDDIAEIVYSSVAPDTWGDINDLRVSANTLLVRHRPDVVREVRALIADLKSYLMQTVEIEARVYDAPAGTVSALAPSGVVEAKGREAFYRGLTKAAAKPMHEMRSVARSRQTVTLMDRTTAPYVAEMDVEVAENSAALDPVTHKRSATGACIEVCPTLDQAAGVCYLDIRAAGASERTSTTVNCTSGVGRDGKPLTGTISMPSQNAWRVFTSAAVHDQATLVQSSAGATVGRETLLALTVRFRPGPAPSKAAPQDPRDAKVREALARKADVNLVDVPPADFAALMRGLANVNVVMDSYVSDEASPVTLTVKALAWSDILDLVTSGFDADVVWTVREGVVWIGNRDTLREITPQTIRIYDLAGISKFPLGFGAPPTVPFSNPHGSDGYNGGGEMTFMDAEGYADEGIALDPDTVYEVIQNDLGIELNDGRSTAMVVQRLLVVRNTAEVQQRIEALLNDLRERRARSITLEIELIDAGRGAHGNTFLPGVLNGASALDADAISRLRAAAAADPNGRVAGGSFHLMNRQRAYFRSVQERAYIEDWDVELANSSSATDPAVSVLMTGLSFEAEAAMLDGGDVHVSFSATWAGPAVDSGTPANPLPQTRVLESTTQEVVKSGQTFAIVLSGPGADGTGQRVLLVTPRILGGK